MVRVYLPNKINPAPLLAGAPGEAARDLSAEEAIEIANTSHSPADMASAEQMAELARLEGTAFDRLFLELMIAHPRVR